MGTFTQVLNLSISASWLVLAVILVRLVLRKAPKAFHCVLWALVAIRLLCPFSLESELSLIPSREIIPEQYLAYTPIEQDQPAVFRPVTNPNYAQPIQVEADTTVGVLQTQDVLATLAWWTGMGAMAIYATYSYLSLRLRVRMAAWTQGRVWECDEIDSPFILGIFRPRIYLPSTLEPATRGHVLAHEHAHLKRRDHLWKPLGYLLLTIHWFNPIMWFAYWLLCRDIELACDERVIQALDRSGVCRYSEALVQCSVRRRNILACPLAFGEVGVKGRVKNMLSYKKPGFWMMVLAIITAIALAGCFMTDPVSETDPISETQPEGIRTGAYLPQELEALDPVYLVLQADGTAWFNYNLSSTDGWCTYTLSESLLTLSSKRGMYHWTFSVETGGFRFLADQSDEKKYLSNGNGLKVLPDGTLFVYNEEETLHGSLETEPQELLPAPTEEFLRVPDNDPEELLKGYDLYSVEPWSANWPIDTDILPETVDDKGVTYPVGIRRVWGHQDSDLWVTGVRSQGENYVITLDFTHEIGNMGEIVLPYSPTDANAVKLSGEQVTELGSGDSFVVTLTKEEYQSGHAWVQFENLYHVKYVSQQLNPQACPLIPGTEIYEANGDIYNLGTPTLTLYPDGTGLYATGFSLTYYPCTYTRTDTTLTVQSIDRIYDKEIQWVFAIEDGVLRFQEAESADMEYWGRTSMHLMENNDPFVLRDTIDSLDMAIWNTLYSQNHKPGELGCISFRVLDAFEGASGQVTAQVCYTYATFQFHDDVNRSMEGHGVCYASITFDLSDGYQVMDYVSSHNHGDLYDIFTETAREARQRLSGHIMDTLHDECWLQAECWRPSNEE